MVACAGNRTIDNAVAYELGTASQSRMVHFELKSDLDGWVVHAQNMNWDRRIIDFVQWKGMKLLNNFDPAHQDYTFACERTWEFVHKLISQKGFENAIPMDKLPILVGTVGQGVAVEFQAYTQIYAGLVSFADILANPHNVVIDTSRPDIIFALTGRVIENATPANIGNLMPFIARLPSEFQVLTMQPIMQKNPSVLSDKQVSQWVSVNAQRLMGSGTP